MSYQEDQELIKHEAGKFPPEFGLRAFPRDKFKILLGDSYMSEGRVILYVGINGDRPDEWQAFCKGSPSELRTQVISLG
jgi:hypothetical protein